MFVKQFMMRKNVFVLDDHEVILYALSELLNAAYEDKLVITHSDKFSVLMKNLKSEDIHLIILDYEINEGTAIELIPLIRQCQKNVKILINTMHDESWIISLLIKQEVDGIVIKTDKIDHIEKAVNDILFNDQKYYSTSATNIMLSVLGDNSAKRLLSYTPSIREKEVIELLSLGLTSEEIAKKIFLSKNTIDAMRKNILLKSGALNVSHLMRIAFLKGWISK